MGKLPGRPKGEVKPRESQMNIRLREEERAEINRAAGAENTPPSTYAREVVLSRVRQDKAHRRHLPHDEKDCEILAYRRSRLTRLERHIEQIKAHLDAKIEGFSPPRKYEEKHGV
ncbi:hypothetical protein CMI37_11250 [Candidatus Pacearchaeota archaeon]|nr:hypothetical protein [Candidatus Pacearchaeota archaeon]